MSPRTAQSDSDRQIAATHKRFVKAMEDRMADLSPDTKDAYFVILTKLVDKLETPEKPLKDIMQEMMAEAMTEVLHIIQA
jgi:hypothetical protein